MIDAGNPIIVDLNIDALTHTNIMIELAESEDEIGCMLRTHLLTEQLLGFYITEKREKAQEPFVKLPWEFSRKLALATAFGLPLPMAAVAHQINNMRNKCSHKIGSKLGDGDVLQLARLVNKMVDVDKLFTPVEKRYITIHKHSPDKQLSYNEEGNRIKFLICSLSFWACATQWLVKDAALRQIDKEQYPKK